MVGLMVLVLKYGDVLVTMVMFIHVLIFKNVMVAMIAHLIWYSKSKCASWCIYCSSRFVTIFNILMYLNSS